jgi:hypothetical protein
MVQSALLAVALAGRIDQGQIARMAGRRGFGVVRGEESLLEGDGDFLGEADADEAAGRQRVAIADQLHRVGGGDDLAFLVALEKRESGMVHHGLLGARRRRVGPKPAIAGFALSLSQRRRDDRRRGFSPGLYAAFPRRNRPKRP